MKPVLTRLFARPADAHCATYHLFVVVAYGLAFTCWLLPDLAGLSGVWSRAVFVLAAAPLLGWISGIDLGVNYHNHAHRPIFRSRAVNRWFERLWTPFAGWPARWWRHLHVAVHHKYLLGPNDWSVLQRLPDGRIESCRRFMIRHWPWRHYYHIVADARAGRFEPREAWTELFWFAVVWPVPFWIDPVMGLCLWLLPQWCANCITMGRGMHVQHAGCEDWPSGKVPRHSNDFLLPFYNRTMFEIGYHSEHHDFPGVHWSELPEFARRRAATVGGYARPRRAPESPATTSAATTSADTSSAATTSADTPSADAPSGERPPAGRPSAAGSPPRTATG